ncbi:hypothetical protein [Campylobacter vicugnae]|uniref:phage nozzle protein n=1 Tax=Campylobacter vicugnae TaxID=1660076 RepID=UPI00254FBD4B|nr:hypothetical protein [Campylobacter ovis]MDL0105237.1 hypothetical protein [Campylobacter ovis]MDL0106656.1 hypothetical protein [Campylobacter ovis]
MTNSTNAQTNLVTRHLAGLFNGISQQAPTIRLDNQAENQINGWSSLVEGLCTRPPTRYLGTPFSQGMDTDLYHSINRDEEERYILKVKAGGEIEVSGANGEVYPCEYDKQSKEYIKCDNPKKELALATIADFTFIANKTKVAQTEKATDEDFGKSKAMLMLTLKTNEIIRQTLDSREVVEYSPAIQLTLDGVLIEVPQKDTLKESMDTLVASINRYSAYSLYRVSDKVIRIYRADGADFAYTFKIGNMSSYNGSISFINGTANYYPQLLMDRLPYDSIAYVYVYKGVAEQNYRVFIDDKLVASYTSGDTNNAHTYKTDVVASSLYDQLLAAGYGVDLAGACVKVFKKDGTDFNIEVSDSWGDAALKCFKGQAQAFTELPGRCFEGAVLKIVGKADEAGGGYWVKYQKGTASGVDTGSGVWAEYRQPYLAHAIDAATMPQQLVRRQNIEKYSTDTNPLGLYFSLEKVAWASRLVGDDDTAPHPSFIGSRINGIFLFSNRLGILSGTSVSLTKTNDFFNFYPSTVTDSLDDEPIDISVSDSNVSNLLYAIPNKSDLLLFSANGQFLLSTGEEPLTAMTAIITPVLNYPNSPDIEPTIQGSVVYFLGKRGDYYVCREYFAQTNTQGVEAVVSNSHCPEILRVNGSKGFIGGVTNENVVFIGGLVADELNIYKYEWNGNTKNQASWSIWKFYEPIEYACEFESRLFCVMKSGRLLRLDFVRDDTLALDCLREFEAGERVTLLDSKDEIYNAKTGAKVEQRDTYDFKVAVGRPYHFTYEFSPIFLKLDNSQIGSIEVATPLRRVRFYLKGLCDFNLTIKNRVQGKDILVYNYHAADRLGELYEKSFILRGDAKRTGVEIQSTSVKPINLQSASFEILTNLLVKPI